MNWTYRWLPNYGLIIILLSIFGIITPAALNKFRRFAIVLAWVITKTVTRPSLRP